jgi:hypothetical protein
MHELDYGGSIVKQYDKPRYPYNLGSAHQKFAPSLWSSASNSSIRPVVPSAK